MRIALCSFLLLATAVPAAGQRQSHPKKSPVDSAAATIRFPRHKSPKAKRAKSQKLKATKKERRNGKEAFFGEIHAGDCRMNAGARIVIWDDGTIDWTSVTRSSDTNDVWHMRLDFYGAQGEIVFQIPFQPAGWEVWNYNEMPEKDTDYPWPNHHWTYDPALFGAVTRVSISSYC